eukprot:TRINITY_DN27495_c0_g3_i3.p1 TRINITY_DN27495_c0_g3~~TRINITY_DN27495_c0_g3_i3.p1  ORF type:complete len:336 (+),score=58.63 TRINITY_DN27495_c0_g3_i3:88-1095(+)
MRWRRAKQPRQQRRNDGLYVLVVAALTAVIGFYKAPFLRTWVVSVARKDRPLPRRRPVRRGVEPHHADGATTWPDHWKRVDEALEAAWVGRQGYGNQDPESVRQASASTYGEVTSTGARQVAYALGLAPQAEPLSIFVGGEVVRCEANSATFADLGSGVGKLVAQAYLEWPSVGKAFGVELSEERSDCAEAAWKELVKSGQAASLRAAAEGLSTSTGRTSTSTRGAGQQEAGSTMQPAVQFIAGDLLEADVADVTHLFLSSLCFEEGLMAQLASKLDSEATSLQAVATLQKFPVGSLVGFAEVCVTAAEMSWTGAGGAPVFVYERVQRRSVREDA